MSLQAVLLPLFVQVVLTLALLYWTGFSRLAVVQRREVHPRDIALRQPNWPKYQTQIANAYQNQLETPVLFYVLTILAIVTKLADLLFVVMAWIFVGLRVFHATIHVTTNHIGRRFAVFVAATTVLALMWAIFIVRILLS